MGLAMDLVALYDTVCGGEIGTNGCHLAVHPHPLPPPHSTTIHTLPSPILHPYRSACGIGYANKELSKMVGNSTNYPFNSWCIARYTMNSYRITVNCM